MKFQSSNYGTEFMSGINDDIKKDQRRAQI